MKEIIDTIFKIIGVLPKIAGSVGDMFRYIYGIVNVVKPLACVFSFIAAFVLAYLATNRLAMAAGLTNFFSDYSFFQSGIGAVFGCLAVLWVLRRQL